VPASTNAPSTASTRASARSTSTPTSASTAAREPVCPVEAIYYEDDLPAEWQDYYTANVEFFDDIGSPGGAAKVGVIAKDHPVIAALPPQAH
jgi:hypothetical protein